MYSKFLLYTFIIIGSVSILYVESANLLEFNYSNSYKKYTLDIKMSDQYSIINDSILNKNGLIIFTPLVEAIYYIK
jgi:hypothetical protein